MVLLERPNGWGIEFMRFRGPNAVSCEIVTKRIQTALIGAYLSTSTPNHLLDLKEALQC